MQTGSSPLRRAVKDDSVWRPILHSHRLAFGVQHFVPDGKSFHRTLTDGGGYRGAFAETVGVDPECCRAA